MGDVLPYQPSSAAAFGAAMKDLGLGDFGQKLADELYRRLREDLLVAVREEVQRAESNEAVDAMCSAMANMAPPVVNVAAPTVRAEVLPADVTVNVPKGDAPKVTVEKKDLDISIVRGEDGKITGAKVKSHG